MAERFSAIVVGLGGMGSATLAQLAQRGVRALGLEQYHPAHALGSSHGGSRIIRKAYFEDPSYVPLLLRAYELWHELERRTDTALLLSTGGLMAGYEGSEVPAGALRSAREHGLAHETLTAAEIRRRFPMLRPRADEVGVYEPDAGVLFPEQCVLAHLQAAVAGGAEARFGVRVRGWSASGGLDSGAAVQTDAGEIECERLILTAGPWLGELAQGLGAGLQPERNVMHWFQPATGAPDLGPGALPLYIVERRGLPIFYGMPDLPGQGMKAAFHYSGVATTPETVDRGVSAAEVESMQAALRDWLPDTGAWRASQVCLYTNTPDLHFVIGRHPQYPQVLLAGGFSGHGFKFCSVVGEILADFATAGGTRHDIRLFNPARPGG